MNNGFGHSISKNLSAGGTISGDVTISGDLTITGSSTYTYDEYISGRLGVFESSPATLLEIKGNLDTALSDSTSVVTDGATGTNRYVASTSHGLAVGDSVRLLDTGGTVGTFSDYSIFTVATVTDANNFILDSDGDAAEDKGQAYRDPDLFGVRNGDDVSQFIIDSSGNVGIGVTPVGAKLHIKGAASTYSVLKLESASASHGTIVEFGDPTDDDYGTITQFASSSGEGGRMRFTAGTVETMNLRAGNVGIGTASPGRELHVQGNIRLEKAGNDNNILEFRNDSKTKVSMGYNAAADAFSLSHLDAGSAAINTDQFILKDGNVGIGVTAPNFTDGSGLHLADDYRVGFGNGANGRPDFQIGTEDGTYLGIRAGEGSDTDDVVITTAGNVGIGTASPDHLLDIETTASEPTLRIFSTITPDGSKSGGMLRLGLHQHNDSGSGANDTQDGDVLGKILFEGQGTDYTYQGGAIQVEVETGDGTATRTEQGTQMSFWTMDTSGSSAERRMTIDEDGSVGIGTADPGTLLEVTDGTYGIYLNGSNLIGVGYTRNQNEIMWLNYAGYQDSNTQYRDLAVGDGRQGNAILYVDGSAGNVGIGTTAPGQLLDVNSGGGNMIADGYDTHSLAVYKENIEDASGYLDKVLACPAQKWNRKPFVSANEIKEAVLEEFGEDVLIEEAVEAQDAVYETVVVQEAVEEVLWAEEDELPEGVEVGDVKTEVQEEETEEQLVSEAIEAKDAVYEKQYSVWDELFPEDNSHRQKALYNMPDGDLKTWIDDWCEAKRVEMRPEDKWQKKRLGLVADAELTAEHLPEVVSINDDGEPTGIDTMTYIGILHNAIQELSAKVEALENA